MEKVHFLNVSIDNLTMDEAVRVADHLIRKKSASFIVTPNVDHLVLLETYPELKDAYDNANLVFADGMPIIWFSRLFGTPIKEKISGSDFLLKLCELAAENGYKMFFLGADAGVAELAARNLMALYKGLCVVGCYAPPFGFEKNPRELEKIDKIVDSSKPDILVVALGCPKQEILINANRFRWNIPLSLGVGAALDFAAGKIKRAPRWMSNSGLEWLYRMSQEPRRMFKRYILRDWKFLKLLWKYKK